MTTTEFARSVSVLYAVTGAREAAAAQRRIEDRATRIRIALPVLPDVARRVSLFSFGTWAQRYPVQSYDLGEEVALFITEWLLQHALAPDTDNLHAALDEWRLRELSKSLLLADEKRASLGKIDPAAIVAALSRAAAPRPVLCGERQPNRFERRRAAARRGR